MIPAQQTGLGDEAEGARWRGSFQVSLEPGEPGSSRDEFVSLDANPAGQTLLLLRVCVCVCVRAIAIHSTLPTSFTLGTLPTYLSSWLGRRFSSARGVARLQDLAVGRLTNLAVLVFGILPMESMVGKRRNAIAIVIAIDLAQPRLRPQNLRRRPPSSACVKYLNPSCHSGAMY